MVSDRKPHYDTRQLDIEIAAMLAEVTTLRRDIARLEAELAAARRQMHVDMGRS